MSKDEMVAHIKAALDSYDGEPAAYIFAFARPRGEFVAGMTCDAEFNPCVLLHLVDRLHEETHKCLTADLLVASQEDAINYFAAHGDIAPGQRPN